MVYLSPSELVSDINCPKSGLVRISGTHCIILKIIKDKPSDAVTRFTLFCHLILYDNI